MVTFVFIVASSLIRATYFPEGDIFWGARNGLDTLRTGINIFQPDTWNLLTIGEEWSPNSWLWNVLLGGSYLMFGDYGFLLLTMLTNIAAYSFLWKYLQQLRIAPLTASIIVVGCWFIMNIFMNGRSNTADFLILAIFLYVCRKLINKPIPLLIISFLLTALWMNLHMTGIAATLIFPAVMYAMMYGEKTREKLLRASHVLLSTLAALPLTPYGMQGLFKVTLVKNESKGLIAEWSNVFSLPEANSGILLLLVISLGASIFIFRKKQFLYGLLMVALIYGTYDTIRLTPFLLTALLGSLVFWEDFQMQLPAWTKNTRMITSGALLTLTLGLCMVSLVSASRVISDPQTMFPVMRSEISLIPANSRVAASQDAGSALILFRPDVLVTLDGRNDLIGQERFMEASNILYSDDPEMLANWIDKHEIDVVFVEDSSTAGAEIIDNNMQSMKWEIRTNGTGAVAYTKK